MVEGSIPSRVTIR